MNTLTPIDLYWIHFLDNIGYAAVALTVVVAVLCLKMWNKQIDAKSAKERAIVAKALYGEVVHDPEYQHGNSLAAWIVWRHAEYARFPQFWAMFWWIMYMTAGSLLSMYLYSIHPPCELRNDCAATEARGIYIGKEH